MLSGLALMSFVTWAGAPRPPRAPRIVTAKIAKVAKSAAAKPKASATPTTTRTLRLTPSEVSPSRFTPYSPTSARLAQKVRLDQEAASPTHIKTFHVVLRDGTGAVLRDRDTPEQFDVAWTRDTDTLDLAPYYHDGKQLLMGVTEAMRPTIATRGESTSSVHAGAPAGIVRPEEGEVSFDRAASRVLRTKVGADADGPLEQLGGSYFPSVGHSPELAYPRAVRVKRPSARDRVAAGEGGIDVSRIKFETPSQVIAKYLQGEYRDTRLALLAFRLAESKGVPITLDLGLPTPTPQRLSAAAAARIADGKKLRSLASEVRATAGEVASVEVSEVPTSAQPFVTASTFRATNLDASGAQLGAAYEIVSIERRQRDSVDYGAYFQADDGKIYVAVKRGVRPVIAVRDEGTHFFHAQAPAIQWEGVAGSLPNEESTDLARSRRAVTELHEEVGALPLHPPRKVGVDMPSPGYSNERVHRFLGEIAAEPTQRPHQGLDESVNIAYVELHELLALGRQGYIRDPRLLLNAHLLRAALQPEARAPVQSHSKQLVASFDSLVNDGSPVHNWLATNVGPLHNSLSRTPFYRRLLYYAENELGLVAMNLSHPEESGFFSRAVPVFAIPAHKSNEYVPLNLLHDLRHYTQGDMVPWRKGPSGKMELMPFADFHRGVDGDEAEATAFSDIVMPHKAGMKVVDDVVGGTSTARAFHELGFGEEAARKALIKIEFDGEIPREILTHPRFEQYKSLLVGRYLKYHILDQRHSRASYDTWKKHPLVASVFLRFTRTFDDVEKYESHRKDSLDAVLGYAEGMNPLRAFTARTMNFDLRVTALSLAYLSEKVSQHAGPGHTAVVAALARGIDELHAELGRLQRLNHGITDSEASPTNLDAFAATIAAKSVATRWRARHGRLIESAKLLSETDRVALKGRELPFFDRIVVDESGVDEELAALLQKSYRRHGLAAP